ncbi:MAG: hypothetical protein D6743_12865 [Calditrichaeota bacterium]|nr:MAG: hypothetical protein D6743_12865 [Calditrichota bacterium]
MWSPDGSKIAYLTNKGNDYLSQTRLAIRDVASGKEEVVGGAHYALSWSPDGTRLAFANNSARSKGGSRYYDLYIYDLAKRKKQRVTRALRAHSPDWSPDGKRLVFVVGKDGTENIATIELASGKIEFLTEFKNGEQVYQPRWSPDGQKVLLAMSTANGRDLYLLDVHSHELSALVDDEFDARDAVFGPRGRKIYFSWDRTGIFNIYAKDLESGEIEQFTNVVGGAFMPAVSPSGEIAYSLFTSDGYKLAVLDAAQPIEPSKSRYLTYTDGVKLASTQESFPEALVEPINVENFDDSKTPAYDVKPYKTRYAPIAFLPRVMIDYGTVKVGSYLYSSDILNKYGFLAGFDVNRHGDYDLFALIEYRNLGPTLFLEAFNQVENTSIPVDSTELIRRGIFQQTSDKFRYNLLEVDAGVKFKLGRSNELRAAFVLSRYSARAKFQEVTGQTTLRYNYFIGRDVSLRFTHRGIKPAVHSEINPVGRQFTIAYDFESNKFLNGFEVNDAFLDEVFDTFNYNKFTLDWNEHWGLPLKNHTFTSEIQAGFIDSKVDSFFHFFGGGLVGNRGYPYFSIEGRKMLLGRFTYRFPLFNHLDLRLLHLYFDKVFFGVFFDYGNAFNEDKLVLSDFKSTVGLQLRMDTFSFYSFPTRFFFDAAYGLDEFRFANQTYGKEWRFYFGVSFGYID